MRSRQTDAEGLELRLLGSFAVTGVVGTLPRKGQALLAYLCRRPGRTAPRETLVGLLWSDSAEEQARASLRQTLSVVKRSLEAAGYAGMQADGTSVSLSPQGLWVDAQAFENLSNAAEIDLLSQAAELVRGEFLEGFGPVAPEFDRWAEAERAQLQARFSALLLRLCDGHAAAGDLTGAIAAAHRLLLVDPLQEQVHRRLMRDYAGLKRPDAALRQFESLKTLLAKELGVTPEPETLDLAKEIRRQRGAQPAAQTQVLRPTLEERGAGRPSVAVLSLKNLSHSDETAFFGEAVAEEIIVELARDRSLLVVSRASSFRFDLEQTDAAEIGDKLGVRFLLGGSVRVAGDQVRVTAHLVQCDSGQTIWSERHDRALVNIFDVQTDIARTVAATVVGRIDEAQADKARNRPLESLESHSLAAQGNQHFISYSEAGYAAAIACFERAVVLDPDFARAHGMLALMRIYRRWYFEMRSDVADLLTPAIHAVKLDPRDAKGHCALGLGHLILRDFDVASHHFQAGLNANPNDDLLLIEYGRYLMYDERPEEGLEKVAEAMRLNPYHPNWYWNIHGRCQHMLGHYHEALQSFQRIHQPVFWIHAYIAACHRVLGDEKAAEAARRALYASRPDFDFSQFLPHFPYRNPETARRFFDEIGQVG